jgi:hypothetical protein
LSSSIVVEHFAGDSLTLKDYLHAAVKQSSLFTMQPETIIGNIEDLATHFREHSLTLKDYPASASQQVYHSYRQERPIHWDDKWEEIV